jgi:predicted dehydrogenase
MTDARAVTAAVVGAGPVGAVHARALQRHSRTRLVAVCGRSSPRAERLARSLGVAAYLSVDEMMRAERPGVVCVCTGNKDHTEPTLAALRGGAHVFVEKPMAFALDEARAMVDTARDRGRTLGVNFNHRFSHPFQRGLAFVAEGRLGDLCYLDMKFAGELYKDLNDPYSQLIETQGHSFDLLRLFGGAVAEVSATLADPRGIGVYTSAAVSLSFAGGAVGTLLGSWDSSYDNPHAQVLEVAGTSGRVVVDNVVDSVRFYRAGASEYAEWRPNLFDSGARDFWATIDAHVDAFVDAVARGAPAPVSGDDGLAALELTYACIESFERGTKVRVGA